MSTNKEIRNKVIRALSNEWSELPEEEKETYPLEGKNEKKRSRETFLSREQIWIRERRKVVQSMKDNSKINNIFITNYKVSLLNNVYATTVLVFYCPREAGFVQIYYPGVDSDDNPATA